MFTSPEQFENNPIILPNDHRRCNFGDARQVAASQHVVVACREQAIPGRLGRRFSSPLIQQTLTA